MLRFMRANTGSWIIKIILGLIVVVFVFLGMGSMGSKNRDHVAMVNDMPITLDEYRQSYQNTIEEMRRRFGGNLSEELLQMLQVKKQAMDRLIEERLISFEADRLDFDVSDKELQESLASIDAFQKNGVFDINVYLMVLSRNRLTPEAFESMQRENIRRSKVMDLVMNSVKVSDAEAREWYIQNNSEVSINYVKFDQERYQIPMNDDAVSQYYEKNREKYKSEPQLTVEYLRYAFDDYRDQAEITSESIELYYEENRDKFMTPEQVEASHILIKVEADADDDAVEAARMEAHEIYEMALSGAEFEDLAREFSQGPTKDKGGYLGTFSRNDMVKPFADKAFSMQPQEIGEPVRTQFGWHVIKVISRIDEAVKSVDEAAPEIRETLVDEEVRDIAYNAASHAFDAVIEGDTLEQAALITGTTLENVGPFTMKGPEWEFPDPSTFARSAFELSLNEIGDIKEIGSAYYIIKPIDRIEPSVLPLENVLDRVQKDLAAQLSREAAESAAREFFAHISDHMNQSQGTTALEKIEPDTIKSAAQERGFELHDTPFFKKDGVIEGLGREPALAEAAFRLSDVKRLPDDIIKGNGGYYVIFLKERKTPSLDMIKENISSARKTIQGYKQSEMYASWMEKLKKESIIEIEPGLIDG
ncbi:MAG: SurA N-terminal domain-containing protein [Desulfamplus sp.]|nr:SurA N-terminal domain-containing protein [Desulfamplus sp.]